MRESSLPARLPAWTTASDDERQEMRTGARRRAESLDARLNAFVSVDAGSPHASGALEGLPYAAKDMFRRPAHEPTCGFATADDMGIVGTCDLFARLDAAGGDFVGFTNMPALAYEPSGWNGARGRVRNPWNPQFIAGGGFSHEDLNVAGTARPWWGSVLGGGRFPSGHDRLSIASCH